MKEKMKLFLLSMILVLSMYRQIYGVEFICEEVITESGLVEFSIEEEVQELSASEEVYFMSDEENFISEFDLQEETITETFSDIEAENIEDEITKSSYLDNDLFGDGDLTEETTIELSDVIVHVNPVYASQEVVENLALPNKELAVASDNVIYLSSIEEAGTLLRSQMKKRVQDIVIYYQTPSSQLENDTDIETKIMGYALGHTGVPTEGDYLVWQYGGYTVYKNSYVEENIVYYTITYAVTYYTTLEQEQVLDSVVSQILNSLQLTTLSEYEKIRTIYDWVCSNVSYDYVNLNDTSYALKHTAYAAAVNKTAVCQGYVVLLYRMLLEVDIDCRVITGFSDNEAHGWNIVYLDGKYYYLDSTWDAGVSFYNYFLKGSQYFDNHYPNAGYCTESFQASYPIASEDYFFSFSGNDGEFAYEITEKGAKITGYLGNAKNVVVPSEVNGYPVRVIGNLTFDASISKNCEVIETITISEGIQTFEDYAIANCYNLKTIHLPSTFYIPDSYYYVQEAGTKIKVWTGFSYVPMRCLQLTTVTVNEANPYLTVYEGAIYSKDMETLYYYPSGDVRETLIIPESVKKIDNAACYYNTYLKSVVIPDGVVEIGYNAFDHCEGITEISIPANCEFIGQYAFDNAGIRELHIPAKVTDIMLGYTKNLEKITVSEDNPYYYAKDGVLFRGDVLIHYPAQKSGTEYIVPDGIKEIYEMAFSYAGKLNMVHLCSTLEVIGKYAFDTTIISEITIPSSVVQIGEKAFGNRVLIRGEVGSTAEKYAEKFGNPFRDINAIEFSGTCGENLTWKWTKEGVLLIQGSGEMTDYKSIQSIPWDSLRKEILSVDIAPGVTSVSAYAFDLCENLTSVVLPEGLVSLGESAFSDTALKKIVFPSTLKSIGFSCFYRCKLDEVILPDSLTVLGNYAFYYNNMKKVTIPASVTEIPDGCFNLNKDLVIYGYKGTGAEKYASSKKFTFVALNDGTESIVSLNRPASFKVKLLSGKKVQVSWETVENADGYRVYRKISGGSWERLKEVSASVKSYTDSAVKAGTKYYYRVRAFYKGDKGKIWSKYTSSVSVIPKTEAPTVTVKELGYNKIQVTWNTVEDAAGYQIYRKVSGGKWQKLKKVTVPTVSYTDSNVVPGTKYYYTVKGYCESDGIVRWGNYKASKSITTKTAAPKLVSAKSSAYNKIKVTWKTVDGATGYQVYRKVSGGSWKKLKKLSSSATSYTDSSAITGTTYYYTVRSYRIVDGKVIWGRYNTSGIKGIAKTAAPTLVSAKILSSGKTKITWKKVEGASGYRIYVKNSNGKWKSLKTVGATTTSYTYSKSYGNSQTYTVKSYRKVDGKTVWGSYKSSGIKSK